MKRSLAQKLLWRAQRFHLRDHAGGGCDGKWGSLYDFKKNQYLGRLASDHSDVLHSEWESIGEQILAIVRRLA